MPSAACPAAILLPVGPGEGIGKEGLDMGRRKKSLSSTVPPHYFKVSPEIFSRKDDLGKNHPLWTYLFVLALSWDGRGCDWTDEAIAVYLGTDERVVRRHIALLESHGLIERVRSSDGGRLLVPQALQEAAEQAFGGLPASAGIRGTPESPHKGDASVPQIEKADARVPQIPRVEDYTRVRSKMGGGGSMPIQDLDLKNNNNNAREEIAPPPQDSGFEGLGGVGGRGEKGGRQSPPYGQKGDARVPQINPAFTTLAGIIGLTTPASVALMARIASEHHVGPRRLLALWQNVQESGGGQGAFVHRLRNGFEPKLLPEPDHDTPGFCPVCGAEISMRYGVGACPNGHELRVCDVCGELAPADGACPWCGARPEEDDGEGEEVEAGAEELWGQALERLQVRLRHAGLDRLLAGTEGVGFDGDGSVLVVRAPDMAAAALLEYKLGDSVLSVVKDIDPGVTGVRFTSEPEESTGGV